MSKWRNDVVDVGKASALLNAGSPHRIAGGIVDLVTALANSDRGAVFRCDADGRLSLLASQGLDQAALEAVGAIWDRSQAVLRAGTPLYSTSGGESFMIAPCVERSTLVGLLYVRTATPAFRLPEDQLATFTRILAGVLCPAARTLVARVEEAINPPEPAVAAEISRSRLVMLLDQQEWNIARVSRILGVTRRTVYKRLACYEIERRWVRRSTA